MKVPPPPPTSPACSAPISVERPSDIPEFEKHPSMHLPVSTKLNIAFPDEKSNVEISHHPHLLIKFIIMFSVETTAIIIS